MLATGQGTYRLDGTPRMRQRPVADLLAALNGLGADARSDLGTGCPPVTIQASGLDGGLRLREGGRLQPVPQRAARWPCPTRASVTTVEVQGALVSQPYVTMTLAVMEAFGVTIEQPQVPPLRRPARRTIAAASTPSSPTPRPPATSSPWRRSPGGTITVEGLGGSSLQGDLAFVDVLEYMGCTVAREPGRTTVTGGPLRAVDVDMNAMSDTVMTLAVVALFADGVSRIRNVAHIRHKESDRIAALAVELRKLGAEVEELPDGLVINPPPPDRLRGAAIATYDDHRMAMSFAMAGLRIPGVTILDPGCVAKTYPGFWDDLGRLRTASPRVIPLRSQSMSSACHQPKSLHIKPVKNSLTREWPLLRDRDRCS